MIASRSNSILSEIIALKKRLETLENEFQSSFITLSNQRVNYPRPDKMKIMLWDQNTLIFKEMDGCNLSKDGDLTLTGMHSVDIMINSQLALVLATWIIENVPKLEQEKPRSRGPHGEPLRDDGTLDHFAL